MPDCLDPNVPVVDNESIECEELISTNCVVSADADLIIRYGRGTTLTKILQLFSNKLKKLTDAQSAYLPTYKAYTVVLSQVGAGTPTVAAILDNGLSITPTITVNGVGDFVITSTGSFTASKTRIFAPEDRATFTGVNETTVDKFYAEIVDANTINLKTSQKSVGGTVLADNLLDGVNTILEIRVYN